MLALESCWVYLGLMLNYTSTIPATGTMTPTLGRHIMDTDMKWYAIVMIFIIGLLMAGLALKEYQLSQCRIEAIKVGMDTDKILQVCK